MRQDLFALAPANGGRGRCSKSLVLRGLLSLLLICASSVMAQTPEAERSLDRGFADRSVAAARRVNLASNRATVAMDRIVFERQAIPGETAIKIGSFDAAPRVDDGSPKSV